MQRISFDSWRHEVDCELAERCLGLVSEDLPDVDYWGLYVTGSTPTEAAKYAVQNAMEC